MGKEVQRNPMDQPPVQRDHSNQDKKHINATSVGVSHSFRNCPTLGNVDWRSLSGAKIPPEAETPGQDNKAPEQQKTHQQISGEGMPTIIPICYRG